MCTPVSNLMDLKYRVTDLMACVPSHSKSEQIRMAGLDLEKNIRHNF